MKKIFSLIKSFWYGLFWGMKVTEDSMLKGNTDALPGSAIIQEVNDKRVSKALLKGEVTQEVKELRYRTYKIDRESKDFEYIAPTLAFRREKQDSKFVTYENKDNLEIITIQPNEAIEESISETLKYVGGRGNRPTYIIQVQRDFFPRYKIEEYTKRLVVFKIDNEYSMLDFYVSKYPNDKDFKSKGFVREIEKIKNDRMKSDVIDFNKVSFTSSHAYKINDMLRFEFDDIRFQSITEYDGHYVIHFKSHVLTNGLDLTDKFYSKTMDEKYKNKVKKDIALDVFSNPEIKLYKCEHCGKEIYYDVENIDDMDISKPREIDDVLIDDNVSSNTEYMDAQICQQTYGIVLCKNCLKKYLKENKLI